MIIEKSEINNLSAIKFTARDNERVLGRAYLYFIYNDLHDGPYGLMEDVFVEEGARGKGVGGALVAAVIAEAKVRCYKLISTSRFERDAVHAWYEKFGFRKYGVEFRMDF